MARPAGRKPTPYELHHKDGSLWARGQTLDGVPVGHWQWFRRDGTRLRSGHFDNGVQTGEWTTYDRQGQVYKVTTLEPKPKSGSTKRAMPTVSRGGGRQGA